MSVFYHYQDYMAPSRHLTWLDPLVAPQKAVSVRPSQETGLQDWAQEPPAQRVTQRAVRGEA